MKDRMYSYLFALPAVVIYGVLFVIPVLGGLYFSFTHWDLFTVRFAGLDNFKEILTNPDMNIGIKNTLTFTVITSFFKLFFGFVLALFLNRKLRTSNFLRSVYFFPAILNVVAVSLIFSALLHPEGPLDNFLRYINLGFLAQEWLGDPKLAIYSICFMEIWKYTGIVMVLLLAGLQTISNEHYEASNIDGANSLQKFRFITFPLIMPSFNNSLVLSIIGGLKVFDIVQTTTGGGPGTATDVLGTIIYRSFGLFRLGLASAGNLMLGIIVLVIVTLFYRVLREKEIEV